MSSAENPRVLLSLNSNSPPDPLPSHPPRYHPRYHPLVDLRQSLPKDGDGGGFHGFTGIFTELLDKKEMDAVHNTSNRNRQGGTPPRQSYGSFPDPYGENGDDVKGNAKGSQSGPGAKVRGLNPVQVQRAG